MAFLALAAASAPAHAGERAAPDLPRAAAAIVEQTNALRRQHGLAAVAAEPRLTRAAAGFAAWMASTDRYGHDADGRNPAQRVAAQDYGYCALAENIAYRYSSAGYATDALADGFVQGWLESQPHRRNLLDAAVTETGVGLAHSSTRGRYYAVQLFGRPQSLRLTLQVENDASSEFGYEVDGRAFRLAPRTTRSHAVCGAGVVVLQLPGDSARRLQAQDGSRYTVRRDAGGRWAVAGAP